MSGKKSRQSGRESAVQKLLIDSEGIYEQYVVCRCAITGASLLMLAVSSAVRGAIAQIPTSPSLVAMAT